MIYELELPETPPSFNQVGHSGSRWTWTKEKKRWQENIEMGLLVEQVPRPIGKFVVATAILRFPTRHKRDAVNYRTLLEKVVGDALVNGRWLPDDTPNEFEFGKVVFAEETGPARTRLILEAK